MSEKISASPLDLPFVRLLKTECDGNHLLLEVASEMGPKRVYWHVDTGYWHRTGGKNRVGVPASGAGIETFKKYFKLGDVKNVKSQRLSNQRY
jgi:hypothetical protein